MIIIIVHLVSGMYLAMINMTEYPFVKEILMMIGIYASILFISILSEIKIVGKFLDFMNKYSLQIYLLHTIFTAAVRIVLIKIGILWWPVHILIGCIFGIGCSVIAAIVAKKTRILNLCFFPTKVYKELKNGK